MIPQFLMEVPDQSGRSDDRPPGAGPSYRSTPPPTQHIVKASETDECYVCGRLRGAAVRGHAGLLRSDRRHRAWRRSCGGACQLRNRAARGRRLQGRGGLSPGPGLLPPGGGVRRRQASGTPRRSRFISATARRSLPSAMSSSDWPVLRSRESPGSGDASPAWRQCWQWPASRQEISEAA
jgi:hypothetical protein